jgi:hypothetical protein
MVQAILVGKKTQTRRVVKLDGSHDDWEHDDGFCMHNSNYCAWFNNDIGDEQAIPVRYGINDILWVRETWRHDPDCDLYIYKADGDENRISPSGKWRPSRYMPREAARIFLRVTDVRIERLQDIIPDDALAEGANLALLPVEYVPAKSEYWDILAFRAIWDEINFNRGFGWDTNPWVWVYTFERCEVQE